MSRAEKPTTRRNSPEFEEWAVRMVRRLRSETERELTGEDAPWAIDTAIDALEGSERASGSSDLGPFE